MEFGGPVLRPYEPTFWDRLAQRMMGDGRASPERRRMVEGILGTSGLGDTDNMSIRGLTVPETPADVALMATGPVGRYAGRTAGKVAGGIAGGLLGYEADDAEAGVLGAGRKGGRNIVQRAGTYWHGISKNRLPIPLEEMSATRTPKGDLQPFREIDPAQLQGGVLIPAIGDRTAAGSMLTHINEKPLAYPVDKQGGADFMRSAAASSPDQAAWASEKPVVRRLANMAAEAGQQGRDPYLVYTAMSNRAGDYSHMTTDALLAQMPYAKITKKAKREFDATMRGHDPNWPGIDDPNLRDFLLKSGSTRTRMAEEMATAARQAQNFPDVASARFAVTEPTLLNAQPGASGYAVSKLDPAGRVIDAPVVPHTTYRTQLGGDGYMGGLLDMVPRDVMWPTWHKEMALKNPEIFNNSAKLDYAFTRAMPKQIADQEWLDGVMRRLEGGQK